MPRRRQDVGVTEVKREQEQSPRRWDLLGLLEKMKILLLLLAFSLPPRTKAGEIIGGHEAKAHSRPYMAYLQIMDGGNTRRCGGCLIREDFVLTAAHCEGSKINVTLGAHNIKEREKTQQIIPVAKIIKHPEYDKQKILKDIMLLKLERKAKRTRAVRPLQLPRRKVYVKPGDVCSVAGWGKTAPRGEFSNTLKEVELTVQKREECESYLRGYYNDTYEICAGDPNINQASYKAIAVQQTRESCKTPLKNTDQTQEQEDVVELTYISQPFLSEEIIGGHEVSPHSRPYMAYVKFLKDDNKNYCGGFLVRDNFVLTAAHCLGSSMTVTLGAHNIKAQEETQQIIPVAKAIPHPAYNHKDGSNDIMLLKLEKKAKRTKAVKTLNLPRRKVNVKPGDVCYVAGWGKTAPDGEYPNTLQEVELTVQKDQQCESQFQGYYNKANQICVGDPKIKSASFKQKDGPCFRIHSVNLCLFIEEIIGGHEVSPHSCPYMTFIKFLDNDRNRRRCGGILVRDNFVLTAAHCLGSSMTVTLGAHNIKAQEETQQIIPVAKAIPHPAYNHKDSSNDIMLLKLEKKAKRTKAVRTLNLPRRKVHVKPGDVCSVAGWGMMTPEGSYADRLQEVELTIQEDQLCESHYRRYYNKTDEICVGDPKIKRASFQDCVYSAILQPVQPSWEDATSPDSPDLSSAAWSWYRSMTVTVGAHNIETQEETQQIIPVAKVTPHPAYNAEDRSSDIMLLKLEKKAKRTKAVRTLNLPRADAQLKPGHMCHLAGWGEMSFDATERTVLLQVAVLIIQDDQQCKCHFHRYIETIQI
ncbi:hypothetical protein STEG23_021991 [Scotinomys teguina]